MKPIFTAVNKTLLALLTALFLLSLHASAQQVQKHITYNNNNIGFYQYTPLNYSTNTKYPLIIFLHGLGERGNGTTELERVLAIAIPSYISNGATMTFTVNGQSHTFLVLSPQLSMSYGSWQDFYVDAMLQYAVDSLSVDTNRIYLTGPSLGGGGTWKYTGTPGHAEKFAAIAPVCGTCDWWNDGLCNLAHANTAVWAFHAQDDHTVMVSCTNSAIDIINGCTPAITPIKTIYPDGDHFIWDRAYNTAHDFHNPNLYEWFLSHSKDTSSCPGNQPPVAAAGDDATIYDDEYMLSSWGSNDPDGTIASYLWTQIGGPTVTMAWNIYATAPISGLQGGNAYTFQLRVTDSCGAIDEDTVVITVGNTDCSSNSAPVAEAGNNLTIDDDEYLLNSWGSGDTDGSISYLWTQLTGPAPATISGEIYATAQVSGLVNGTYSFKLKVTDNCGAIDEDTIFVTVDMQSGGLAKQIAKDKTLLETAGNFLLYPNPAGNRLYIDAKTAISGKLKLSLADISGRVIRKLEIQPAALKAGLDLTGLKQGVYILQIETNGERTIQKFVKQ